MKRLTARIALAALAAGFTLGSNAQDIVVVDGSSQMVEDGAVAATVLPVTTFPNENIGGTSSMQFFILNESFTDPLSITNVTFSGANPEDFLLADSSNIAAIQPKPASDSGYLIIHFKPTALGVRTAQINIFSNDPDSESVYTFTISGTGVDGPIAPLPDLLLEVLQPKKVKISKEGRVTVKGQVVVQNTGPVQSDLSLLEIYVSNKNYLDDTATLVKVRSLKKIKAPKDGKTYSKKVKYNADGNGYTEGYIIGLVSPVLPASDRNWSGNVRLHRYPNWND